jgi:ABC-2 type transport system permease protein
MNGRRVSAVARKEFLHVLRDPRSLAMGIAIPMLLLLLFGFALTLDVDNVPLVVWDQDQAQASRELISRFSGSRYFSLREAVRGYPELVDAVDAGRAMAALVIPPEFTARIETGRDVPVQLIVDGSDANTASLAISYAEAVVQSYSQEMASRRMEKMGGPELRVPLEIRPRVWFNPELESKNYIIPGLIAVIMMVIAALLTSLTVAREWERGTMEQLISTPVKGHELILGKLVPYFVIGMVDVAIAVLMGEFLFDVPMRGEIALLFGTAAVFLAGALGMGMLISVVMKNQLLASQFAMVTTFLPAFLPSGFMFAIANMPKPIQVITHIVPARYFVTLLKGIYLKGVGLEILAGEALLLAVYGAIVLLLANVKFKKKLA